MRRRQFIKIGSLFLLAPTPRVFGALPASDDFERASLGANWTQSKGTMALNASSDFFSSGALGEAEAAFWNADAFNADQYSECVVSLIGADYVGVCARASASPTFDFYAWVGNSSGNALILTDNGVQNVLVGPGTPAFAVSDVIRMEITGTSIVCKQNGNIIHSITNANIASGAAGIAGLNPNATSTGESWTAGNMSAPPPRRRPIILL